MENKSLFTSITLTILLVAGYLFYNDKINNLEYEITQIITGYDSKINTKQSNNSSAEKPETSILEGLNNQLVETRAELQVTQRKLTLATSKTSVLDDEIAQIHDARSEVNRLKDSLKKTKISLQTTQKVLKNTGTKLDHLQDIFESQNKETIMNNMSRINELKETSTGIAVTGLIVPAFGVATLISYTAQEINNYCANIKNTINLENKVFKKVVSLDSKMLKNYHQQCEVSLKDKVKQSLKNLQTSQ